jgi:hypothetical protein
MSRADSCKSLAGMKRCFIDGIAGGGWQPDAGGVPPPNLPETDPEALTRFSGASR